MVAFCAGLAYWAIWIYLLAFKPSDYPGSEFGGLLMGLANILGLVISMVATVVALGVRARQKRISLSSYVATFLVANVPGIAQCGSFSIVTAFVPGNWNTWGLPWSSIAGVCIGAAMYSLVALLGGLLTLRWAQVC